MNKLWRDKHTSVAKLASTWSHDPSTKVGAVLARNKRTLATGFNRFPEGHSNAPELWVDREYKYKHVIHAEIIALQNAQRYCDEKLVRGSTMVTNFPACPDCIRAMAAAGVLRVIQPRLEDTEGFPLRATAWVDHWRGLVQEAAQTAAGLGVEVVEHGQ